jgi:hypothetical protein
MIIDLRAAPRMRGKTPLEPVPAIESLLAELAAADVDLERVRVVCDWIQYKESFRVPVALRPVLTDVPAQAASGSDSEADAEPASGREFASNALEIAVDLRRGAAAELGTELKQALAGYAAGITQPPGIALEPWAPTSQSCIWQFNSLYWRALDKWELATGRGYEQALPGGRSDARDVATVRDIIYELLRIWDELDARHALPAELYVVELGVGNGSQARVWLDEFAHIDRTHGRDYYQRLHYLIGDYSPQVLERARQAVQPHADRVSSLVLEATRPQVTLGFLRDKAFCVYISNVYDNLPTDQIAAIGGRHYLVQSRAYLPAADAADIAAQFTTTPAQLPALTSRLLRLGPELLAEAAPAQFADLSQAVSFWQRTWTALRLTERYVPLEGLDQYAATSALTGEVLRPLLEGQGDVTMHVSNGALASFADTLALLHPYGRLICHDLFVTEPGQYRHGFYGPGKYDGSVVNWVNGPLLQLAASRRGFGVTISPFAGRPNANVRTLTATVRD